jgi:hypothetical protein
MTNTFVIENTTQSGMNIIHEPECFEFLLPSGEELTVETNNTKNSICIRPWIDNGIINISIWDDKSPYRILYKGCDVFEQYF